MTSISTTPSGTASPANRNSKAGGVISRLTIKTKLLGGFTALVLLGVGTGVVGIMSARNINDAMNKVTNEATPLVEMADHLVANNWEANKVAEEIFSSLTTEDTKSLTDEIHKFEADFEELAKQLAQLTTDDAIQAQLSEAVAQRQQFVANAEAMIAAQTLYLNTQTERARQIAEADALGAEILSKLQELVDANRAQMTAVKTDADRAVMQGATAAEIAKLMEKLFSVDLPTVKSSTSLQMLVWQLQDAGGTYVQEQDADQLPAIEAEFQKLREAMAAHFETIKKLAENDAERQAVVDLEQAAARWTEMGSGLQGFFATQRSLLKANADRLNLLSALEDDADKVGAAFDDVTKRADELGASADAAADSAVISAQTTIGAAIIIALLVGGGLVAMAIFGITRPLSRMTDAMKKIADSDFNVTIPGLGKKDEIGAMAGALAALRETSIEAARGKSAIESVSSNVMVADSDGKIVFANKTVTAMLKSAEADIRKDLPRFDAGNLIGRNFDEFHRNPSHQRNLLANLSTTYRTSIKVGGRSFNLIANPAMNSRGERIGTVVEWADMTQELAVQTEVADLVNAVATGDLSKRLHLAGKAGFMKTLAEGINQVTETVAKAMGEVVSMMSAMAKGDLSKRISGDYQGEFLKLKEDANATAEKLAEIVGQTVEGMANIKASTTEISTGATDLSSRTEQQVASLEEIAASMRQVNTTVQQSAENARQASQLAVAARSAAESGGEVAGSAVKAMAEIEQSSQKISDIVGMIDEIAFQTNLLALNAAVEAARAGEAGRGFAVVAGEVRALAQRSSQASKEIKALITNSNSQVKQGVELVNKAGTTLSEIVTSVKRVSDIVAEISAASKEQATSVNEVQEAVGQIEQATQQNAALVEETTAALGSADNQVQGVTDVIAFFKSDVDLTAKSANAAGPAKGAKAVQAKLARKVGAKPAGTAKHAPAKKVAATGTDDGWEEF